MGFLVGFLAIEDFSLTRDAANLVGSAKKPGEGRGCSFLFGLFEQVRFAHLSPGDFYEVPAESTLVGLYT